MIRFYRLILLVIVCAVATAFLKEKPLLTAYAFPVLKFFPSMPQSVENSVTVEGAALGRRLFYDRILSGERDLSCASCHKQEFAFSDGKKRFSSGSHNSEMKRNTPALFNLAWYSGFFWDGRATTIESQVFEPVRAHDEMNITWKEVEKRLNADPYYKKQFLIVFGQGKIDSVKVAKAIAQFERTLISYRSRFDRCVNNQEFFTTEERKGFELMNDMTKGNCLHCHTTDADVVGTTGKFSNNGLDTGNSYLSFKDAGRYNITQKASDVGVFKIPSLRNLVFTAPYMHDGRFQTLEEVLDFYSSGVHAGPFTDSKMGPSIKKGGVQLTADEKKCIITFLKTMSDSAFVNDPAFSDPFKK